MCPPALCTAIYAGDVAEVQRLLETGIDIDADRVADISVLSALHFAVWVDNPDICRLLLRHPQVDVNVPSSMGNTPLHFACGSKNSLKVLGLLLGDPRVQADVVQQHGRTPLLEAVRNRHMEVVKALLLSGKPLGLHKAGRNESAIGPVYTPLALARYLKMVNMVDLLTSFEVDPAGTRHSLRLAVNDPLTLAVEVSALAVMLSDGFFSLSGSVLFLGVKLPVATRSTPHRFFGVMQRLPMELQMFLSLRSQGLAADVIMPGLLEPVFRRLASSSPR